MISGKSKALRLQELAAHPEGVNCLRLGRKSGRVLATGGDDKRVNVWALGKPNAIMSLTGHTTSIKCVVFDFMEEVVIAGSFGGSLKIWDLEEKKVVRTLPGHNSVCTSIDYHPCGEFFASGSQDTLLKVWDIRLKKCVQTYKGHQHGIEAVKFSPDGRWLASGSDDGVIKLWDVTAGKLLKDFTGHRGSVSSLDFHPVEFLMASGSHDGSCKFWDLERFDVISTTAPSQFGDSPMKTKTIAFSPDGTALLSAYQDSLKVFGWEPERIFDSVAVNWGNVADINVVNDQLVACSFQEGFPSVQVWVVNLSKLLPFSDPSFASSAKIATIRPRTSAKSIIKEVEPTDTENVVPELNSQLTFTPVIRPQPQPQPIPNPAKIINVQPSSNSSSSSSSNAIPPTTSASIPAIPTPASSTATSSTSSTSAKPASTGSTNSIKRKVAAIPPPEAPRSISPPSAFAGPPGGPMTADLASLLRKPSFGSSSTFDASATAMDPNGLADELCSPHLSVCSVLNQRLTNLKAIRAVWGSRGADSRAAIETLDAIKKMGDPAILVDFVSTLGLRDDLLTLDVCVTLLPMMKELLSSPYEPFLGCALTTIRKLVKAFGSIIQTTIEAPVNPRMDLVAEERLDKCKACSLTLRDVKKMSVTLSKKSGAASIPPLARELLMLLKPYFPDTS